MHFTAGSLKTATKTFSHRLRSKLRSFDHHSRPEDCDRRPLLALSNLPNAADTNPSLSPLDVTEFGESCAIAFSEEQRSSTLWSTQVGTIVRSDEPLSAVGFASQRSLSIGPLEDSETQSNASSSSNKCRFNVSPHSSASAPSLVEISGALFLPVRQSTLPAKNISNFIRSLPTTQASSGALICIFGPYDIVGPHDLASDATGFAYCDPGAVDVLETLRTVIQDDIPQDSRSFSRNWSTRSVHCFREVPDLSVIELHDNGPLVEYLGLYQIRIPSNKYLSPEDWATVPTEIQQILVDRYSRLEVSQRGSPVGRLTISETRRLYQTGKHVPLIELFPVPPQEYISRLPRAITPPPVVMVSPATPPASPHAFQPSVSELSGIPEPVASFLLAASRPDFHLFAESAFELELASSIVRSLKLDDRQLHDRCLQLVLKYAGGKCDVSPFVSNF